jgi:hypothetical protein
MCLGYFAPAGISENVGVPQVFRFANIAATATVDEGNNWINMTYGPLTLSRPGTTTPVETQNTPVTPAEQIVTVAAVGATQGAYSLPAGSAAIGAGNVKLALVPQTDFYGNPRTTSSDIGAVQYLSSPVAKGSIAPAALTFASAPVTTPVTSSAAQTLTLSSTGTANLVVSAVTVSTPFVQTGGTCANLTAAGLAPNSSCTITVAFAPTATGPASGTVTITSNSSTTIPTVTLTGTGVAAVKTATFTPSPATVTQTRNCPGTGLGALACALDPTQTFTLTNTGNVPVTGITQGALSGTGTNPANFTIVRLLSTCGPAGNGQLAGNTTLAPGASCVVTLQFKPLTAQAAGAKTATVSVSDSIGTQSSTVTDTAK